jgi:hypothetical protein
MWSKHAIPSSLHATASPSMMQEPERSLASASTMSGKRHHVGIPGDIISECPGDFIGIRNGAHQEHAEQFTSTLANVGQELDYLDGPDGHRR